MLNTNGIPTRLFTYDIGGGSSCRFLSQDVKLEAEKLLALDVRKSVSRAHALLVEFSSKK